MKKKDIRGCLNQAAFFIVFGALFSNASLAAEEIARELVLEYSSPVMATRGNAKLTHLELDARLQAVPERDRAGVVTGPARLQKLIEDQLQIRDFAGKAIEAGILEDELVQAQLYMMVSAWLAERYRDQVVAEQELDDYSDQAREIYLLNPERFEAEPSVSFTHLLIQNSPQAESQALDFLSRVQAGEVLSELAVASSEDPSVADNQGKFHAIELNMLESGFRSGIEAMSAGEVDLVQSAFGWHVVQLDQILPSRTVPYEEVEGELIEEAKNRHKDSIIERLLRAHYAEELNIAEGGVAEVLNRYTPMND